MNIYSLSDLHLEFHTPDTYSQFIGRVDGRFNEYPPDSDSILVLAGDIFNAKQAWGSGAYCLAHFLNAMHGHFTKIIFVPGNHEFYVHPEEKRISMTNREMKVREIMDNFEVIMLQNEHVTINGVSFYGGTMWTDLLSLDPGYRRMVFNVANDGKYIGITPEDFGNLHDTFVQNLQDSETPDVVISHYSPFLSRRVKVQMTQMELYRSKMWHASMEEYLTFNPVKLWIHGHTHEQRDEVFEQTRVVSNPLGYPTKQVRLDHIQMLLSPIKVEVEHDPRLS